MAMLLSLMLHSEGPSPVKVICLAYIVLSKKIENEKLNPKWLSCRSIAITRKISLRFSLRKLASI